jgi:hypothetical protein
MSEYVYPLNPNYDYEKLGLEMLAFDEPNLSYEFNTLCFWATKDGQIYSASDSGCSCPTPFEDYVGEDQKEVLQKLERVGSLEHAEGILKSWNKDYDGRPYLGIEAHKELSNWFKLHFKM